MAEKRVTALSIVLLVVGLLAGGIVTRWAFPREVVREVPKEVVKEIPKEVVKEVPKEVTKEVPMALTTLAQGVAQGKIDVGKEYGLAPDQRYHKIHSGVLGLPCTTCHVQQVSPTLGVFSTQDVSPKAPGPVDRRACLGCHSSGGPARTIYETTP